MESSFGIIREFVLLSLYSSGKFPAVLLVSRAMNKKLFEWWLGRPKPVRYAVALFFLGASTVFYLLGRVWFWGWAFGGALLIVNLFDHDDPI